MKKTNFTFRADESTNAGVVRIANGLIAVALQCSRRSSSDTSRDVHLFRTTTKRLRALLQLIQPVITKTTFERETSRLKRSAGRLASVRDRAVAAETLKALARPAADVTHLVKAIDPEKAPIPARHPGALRNAADELERSQRAFGLLRIQREGWNAIGPGLRRSYRQTRRRMRAAYAHPSDRAFHRWRIRVKQLFYQLQWLVPLRPRRFTKMLKRLHQLEEKLGADHDLVILRELLAKAPARGDDTEVIEFVAAAATAKSERLRRACESIGAKVLGETPRRFSRTCVRCRRYWEQ